MFEFDKTRQYGNFIVINAAGPDDVLAPADKEIAEKEILKNAHNVIPEPSRSMIVVIHHGPTWYDDPDNPGEGNWVFTVAWKYTLPKEASVG